MAKPLTELMLRHGSLINSLIYAVADHAELIYKELPKCECGRGPVTVTHRKTGIQRCDRCCAEAICLAHQIDKMNADPGNMSAEEMALDLLSTTDPPHEHEWVDLPEAFAVRRISEHHDILGEDVSVH